MAFKIIKQLKTLLPSIDDMPRFSARKEESIPKITTERSSYGVSRILFTDTFDGEKEVGGIGPIKSYLLDYAALRLRSWQALLESEIAQIVVYKYVKWVIGKGLKLQSEPSKLVLESEGIDLDIEKFSKLIEARFGIYSENKICDHANMWKKGKLAKRAKLNALVGGDVLVVLRYENDFPTIQLIDGAHVQSPMLGNDYYAAIEANGNTIKHGVEIASNGEHVAYYVLRAGTYSQFDRIPATGEKSGLKMAFLYYGLEYRLDNVRGLPLLAVVLESIAELDRYKGATLGSAEERQKISYFIKHDMGSTGEHPGAQQIANAIRINADVKDDNDFPIDVVGNELAAKVQATTTKTTFNMPSNSTLESLDSKNELYFKDFYGVHIDLICAAVSIPPDVALSKYTNSYSSSRASLKDWEHTLIVDRDDHAYQFEQPIYDFFLEVDILKNKIQAPGYIIARKQGNEMVIGAYRKARFTGANVPHIDPLKEVMAEREKLGPTGASFPLTTQEQATEALNGGDSDTNTEQFARELNVAKGLGIEFAALNPPIPKTVPAGQ